MSVQQSLLKAIRGIVELFFPQDPRLLITPRSTFLVSTKKEQDVVHSFESIDAAAASLKKIDKPFEVYLEGFDQTLATETLPSLTFFERRSYLRHKVRLLLEKAPFAFVTHHQAAGTFVTENWPLPGCFKTGALNIKAVRSLSLEIARAFTSPTLLRLSIQKGEERLFYGADQTLYFTRTIPQQDKDAYEKTIRYIERQFHQPAQTLTIKEWAIDELAAFIAKKAPSPLDFLTSRVLAKSQQALTRFYYLQLGLKGFSALLGGLFLFLSVNFYQNWQEKEALQSVLFTLTQDLKAVNQEGAPLKSTPELSGSKLSDKDLDHFEKLLQRQAHPLKDFKLLAPLNTDFSFLKGLVWTAKKGKEDTGNVQMTLQLCSHHRSVEELENWVTETLRVTAPLLDIHCRDASQDKDLLEQEDSENGETCLVVNAVKRGPSS